MPTVAEVEFPATEVALEDTFSRVPGFEFTAERIVEPASGNTMPLLWLSAPANVDLSTVLGSDPSVVDYEQLDDRGERSLYRIEFTSKITIISAIIVRNDGSILDGSGRDGMWRFRVLFPDRDSFSTAYVLLKDRNTNPTIRSLTDLESEQGALCGLTDGQYELLQKAYEMGYFDVPRGVTLKELADEFDVTHQSISERLRRANKAIVRNELGKPDASRNRTSPAELGDSP